MLSRFTFFASLLACGSALGIDPPTIFRVEPDHSATEQEAGLRGLGAAAEGMGVGLHHAAAAQIKFQEARKLALENHYEALDQQARLKSQRDHKQRELRQISTPSELARRARDAAPARLTRNDATIDGQLIFPAALLSVQFADEREELQATFERWRSAPTAVQAAKWQRIVTQQCAALTSELQQEVRTLNSNDYLAARRFLERCAHETRFNDIRLPSSSAPALVSSDAAER